MLGAQESYNSSVSEAPLAIEALATLISRVPPRKWEEIMVKPLAPYP